MKRMKIKAVKGFTAEEVFDGEVPDHFPETFKSPCPMHPAGQEFDIEGTNYPEGLCLWAFAEIFRDIIHLWRGSDYPWVGKPGVMYSSCTDGRTPVVFKLERIED